MKLIKESLSLKNILIGIFCIYFVWFTAKSILLGKTVYGDGIFYYSWLRSIVIDKSVDFSNEYSFFGVKQLPTKNGLIGNQFAVGPALFWSPLYISLHQILRGDGFSFLYQYIVGLHSVSYVLLSFILLQRLFSKLFSYRSTLLTLFTVAFATNIFFYGSLDTVNSHAISFFIATLLLISIVEKKSLFSQGLLVGLLGMVRIQDSAFILIPFILLTLNVLNTNELKKIHLINHIIKIVSHYLLLFIGFSLPLILQFFAWFLIYGDIRIPYLERGYGFNFFHSSFFQVLFSTNNGIFTWTPIILIAFLGLLFVKNSTIRKLSYVTFFFFVWQTYLIGSWSIWWQGASFSGRMFISLIPFLMLGLATFYSRISLRNGLIITSLFSFLNVALVLYFLLIT